MTPNRKKACALVRVSSEEQARGGYGLEFQEQDIRTFCDRNNLALIEVFRDEGYSGATSDRPGFREMMGWARDKRFEVLVVWKLDRLFRDTKLTLQTVDELASLGIEFRSVQESFTHDSNGRFLLTIFAAGAEKERKDITMRMYAGRIASARKGTWINGGAPPYGYRYNRKTKWLEIDKEEARVVKQIFCWLVDERLSLYRIQCRLNEMRVPTKFDRLGRKKPSGSSCWWGKRTIGRILTNEVYTGTFTFRKYRNLSTVRKETNQRPREDWITVKTPAIVSKKTFGRAGDQLRSNSDNSPRRTKTLYLLRKLLVCGYDGRRMQAARRPPDRWRECKYYFCSATRKGFAAARCPSHSVSESRIAPPVWEKLKELLSDPATAIKQLAEYRDYKTSAGELSERGRSLATQKGKAAEKKPRLVELYLGGAVDKDFFQTGHRQLKEEVDQIDRELKKVEGLMLTREEMISRGHTIQSLCTRYREKLNSASDEAKREILTTFVRTVTVRGEELEIEVALPPSDGSREQAARPVRSIHEAESFAGQPIHGLSRKENFSIFLKAWLIPKSEIFRKAGLHKNFRRPNGCTLPFEARRGTGR